MNSFRKIDFRIVEFSEASLDFVLDEVNRYIDESQIDRLED